MVIGHNPPRSYNRIVIIGSNPLHLSDADFNLLFLFEQIDNFGYVCFAVVIGTFFSPKIFSDKV